MLLISSKNLRSGSYGPRLSITGFHRSSPMRVSPRARLSALALAVATASFAALASAGITSAAAAASAASSVHYVALGDSYSSAVGAGDYSDGSCDQSSNAYPVLWADATAPASFANETCSGATTSSVLSSQLSPLSSSTTLVSITVGGNDVGFSSVMETCVLESTSSCLKALAAAQAFVTDELPARLNTTLATIKDDAPDAKIVVL